MELLTPSGLAGIAVVRASLSERDRVATLLRSTKAGALPLRGGMPPARAALTIEGLVVDDVLVLDRGERGLELHLHGSPAVLDALRRAFALTTAVGGTPAQRLIRSALSVEQLQLGLEQSAVDFDAWCATLDRLALEPRRLALQQALERSLVSMALANPQRVVLIGRQNAGKSSLFNRLLARERVTTGPTPGLTRDPVAECTSFAGYPYELVDTAGHGPTASALDAAAIVRGDGERGRGSLQLLVVDSALGPTDEDRRLLSSSDLVLATKSDLPAAQWPTDVRSDLRLSCTTTDAASLRDLVGQLLRTCRRLPPAGRAGGPAALEPAQWQGLRSRWAEAGTAST